MDDQARHQPAWSFDVRGMKPLLFKDLAGLWSEATPEGRSRLIAPLVERVYVDVETRRIAAITPAEGFGSLLQEVLKQPDWSACFLLPAEAANQPDRWTWWRRESALLAVPVLISVSTNGRRGCLEAADTRP